MAAEIDALLQKLKAWGCDVEGALARFLEDKELYEKCLAAAAEDETIEALGRALEEKNIQDAFEAAHTLKGVLANLGLTPLYERIVLLVEPLRVGQIDGMDSLYADFLLANQQLKKLLGKEG